jgi:hypothetical protein
MRNGFTSTLAAVAFACLGFQAFAVAPVINQIPSPVVTDDANPVSGPYLFVYADWIDLRAYTTDDGNVSNLIWSYEEGTGRYTLNNAVPLASSAEALSPAATKIINSAGNIAAGPELDPDGSPYTVTVRDVIQSPIGGPNVPGGINPGDIVGQAVITLYASDGTTVSAPETFTAYTQAYGGDNNFVTVCLSPRAPPRPTVCRRLTLPAREPTTGHPSSSMVRRRVRLVAFALTCRRVA